MNMKCSLCHLARLGFLTIISGLWLAGCALYPLGSENQAGDTATVPAYPPPVTIVPSLPPPLPTLADGSPNFMYSAFATPSPDETVGVAGISEIAPEAGPPPRYSIEYETVGDSTNKHVLDSQTGDRVRLGDDSGRTLIGTMNDEYVLWFFLCDPCQTIKSGLHAYELHTGKDTWIAEQVYTTMGSVKISDQWALYMTPSTESHYLAQLYAYNLKTDENLLIASDALLKSAGMEKYNAINEGMVAWVAVNLSSQEASVKVYDLARQATQQIIVPKPFDLRNVNVSRHVVVWQGWYWQGYDLVQGALFTIPVVPPGWDVASVRSVGPVMARGRQLFWTLDVDGQTHHFTAPVVERKPQPTSEIPVSTATAVPTSYP